MSGVAALAFVKTAGHATAAAAGDQLAKIGLKRQDLEFVREKMRLDVIQTFLQGATQVENYMHMCDNANVEYETKNQQRLCEALKCIVPALTALDTLKEFMLDGDWVEIRRGTSESFGIKLSKVKPHSTSGLIVTSIADSAPDTVRAAGLSEGSIVSCAQVQKKDFCGRWQHRVALR
jgi:hypothetical protein